MKDSNKETVEHHWPRVKVELDRLLELGPRERQEALAVLEGEDPSLHRSLQEYLALEDSPTDFLEAPVLRITTAPVLPDRSGEELGVYRLERRIATGGMGEVYLGARADALFEQRVAIKVLKAARNTGDLARRFEQERRILAQLNHPHIAGILDGGTTGDGLPYLVMEHVEGEPIDVFCRSRTLAIGQRLDLFRKVCAAVQAAHGTLVVHCDLKPENILVRSNGEPVLVDFGIAQLLREEGVEAEGGGRTRLATPRYASPEQMAGGAITTASDIFSLGVLLAELLLGRQLPRDWHPGQPIPWADPTPGQGSIPLPLKRVVERAVQPEAAQRYPSAGALAAELRNFQSHRPVGAVHGGRWYRGRLLVRRNPATSVAVGVIALLTVGFLLALAAQLRETRAERDRATELGNTLLDMVDALDTSTGRKATEEARRLAAVALQGELSPDPGERAFFLNRLGRILYRYEFFGEAEALYSEALRLRRGTPGTEPKALAASLSNLALLYVHTERGGEAVPLIREAMELQASVMEGGDPLSVAQMNTYAVLATAMEQQGSWEAAEALFRRILEERERRGDGDSEEGVKALNNLGGVLYQQRRFSESVALMERALVIRRRELDPRSEPMARVLINTGLSLAGAGEAHRGEELLREALAIREGLYEEGNPVVERASAALAYILLGRGGDGDLEEAEARLRAAVEVFRMGDATGREVRSYQRHWAEALLGLGRAEEAAVLIAELLSLNPGVWGSDREAWRIADLQSLLGDVRRQQGRLSEAERLLVESYRVVSTAEGTDSHYTRGAARRLERLRRESEAL